MIRIRYTFTCQFLLSVSGIEMISVLCFHDFILKYRISPFYAWPLTSLESEEAMDKLLSSYWVVDKRLKMSKWGERLKKVEQLAQSFQRNPLTSRYKPRLWPCQPSSIWKLFPRQSLAISFAQSCKEVAQQQPHQSASVLYVYEENMLTFVSPFTDYPRFCTWKRKIAHGSEDLPGY